MNLKNIGPSLVSAAAKVKFWSRKNSPELLIVGSIVTAAASIYLACVATTKVEAIVQPANTKIKQIHTNMKDDNKLASGEYSINEGKKELFLTYSKTGFELIKLYAPSAISFGLSIAALLGSHKIMKGRNIALAAAYTTLENGYKNYRDRVKSKIGEKAERDIFRNMYSEEYIDVETDKNGNEKSVTKKIKTAHVDPDADFVYLFDASNPDWERSGRLNVDFLLAREKYLNQRFVANGYMFLSDVYDNLGIDPGILGPRKLHASRIIGWIYDPEDPTRDNYISFGLADKDGNLKETTMEMLRDGERNIWLEFNPDGDILNGPIDGKTFMKYARVY
jgi:hypothetical protein